MIKMKDYLDKTTGQTTFKVSKTPKIDYLIKEKRFSEALIEIDNLLADNADASNWNLKGIILDNLSQYNEAIIAFDKSLSLEESDEVNLNKANCYYNWAKVSFFPQANYEKALELIDNALNTIPDDVDKSEFYFLKAEILEGLDLLVESHKSYLIAYKEFDRLKEFESQIDYLDNTDDTLFIVTGCDFYNFTPHNGIIVDLVLDDDNEHDPDAIAVVVDGNTVGYVANSDYTLIDEVNSASDIKKLLGTGGKGEILFIYFGEYVIAKLL